MYKRYNNNLYRGQKKNKVKVEIEDDRILQKSEERSVEKKIRMTSCIMWSVVVRSL
jgi:hypothetical protein